MPVVLAVDRARGVGPALLLGLADHVVMTADVLRVRERADDGRRVHRGAQSTPTSSAARTCHARLHRRRAHRRRRLEAAHGADRALLAYLPSHIDEQPPRWPTDDPADRPTPEAGDAASPMRRPAATTCATVIEAIVDDGELLELRAGWAPNLVTALRDDRRAARSASSPTSRSPSPARSTSRRRRRARGSSRFCDAFNLPLITLVDTPGFYPGKDLEWRGMIRHGAQLVFAYARATVPRICVILRKSYGGAYIVMDSKKMGNDLCLAWPGRRARGDGRRKARSRSCTGGRRPRSAPRSRPTTRSGCSTRTSPPSGATSTPSSTRPTPAPRSRTRCARCDRSASGSGHASTTTRPSDSRRGASRTVDPDNAVACISWSLSRLSVRSHDPGACPMRHEGSNVPDTITITDDRTGKTVTVPITDGVFPSSALRELDPDLCIYDPAFMSTAACASAITYLDGDAGILRYRGYPIEQLAEQSTYLEVAYLLLNGELPDRRAARARGRTTSPTTRSSTRTCASGSWTASTTTPTRWGCSCRPSPRCRPSTPTPRTSTTRTVRDKQILRLIAKMPTLAAVLPPLQRRACRSSTPTTRSTSRPTSST